jgi:hypothetical protein
VTGGQKFLGKLESVIEDPALRQKVMDAFTTAHVKAQDKDVQAVVDHLIK